METLSGHFPNLHFFGVGGEQMRARGIRAIFSVEESSVMGWVEGIKEIPRALYRLYCLRRAIFFHQPQIVFLIDYVEFHSLLARALRRKGFSGKIVQYVAPTVWAWREKRKWKLASTLDLLLVIFPFEPAYFAETTLRTIYVGHPLLSLIPRKKSSLQRERRMITLFPGSRPSEIFSHLPLQLHLMRNFIIQSGHQVELFISFVRKDLVEKMKDKCAQLLRELPTLSLHFFSFEERYEMMQRAHVAVATSGTVTLELALHSTPTLVLYKLSYCNFLIAKYLLCLDLPHYCIVNILAQRELFPEFFFTRSSYSQWNRAFTELFSSRISRQECMRGCQQIRKELEKGLFQTSHQKILEEIDCLLREK